MVTAGEFGCSGGEMKMVHRDVAKYNYKHPSRIQNNDRDYDRNYDRGGSKSMDYGRIKSLRTLIGIKAIGTNLIMIGIPRSIQLRRRPRGKGPDLVKH